MSSKNQNQQHRCNNHNRVGFGESAPARLDVKPCVQITLDKYEELIRASERAEIVARYIAGAKYSVDKETALDVLGKREYLDAKGGEET